MQRVVLDRPWLEFDLGAEMQVLSWAINRPGFVRARRILWREVRNADLPVDFDVDAWFESELAKRSASDAVAFLTSRDIREMVECDANVGKVSAKAIATVGLSNAERVGDRLDRSAHDWGTINVALRLNVGLKQAAMIEALSIAVAARTAAVIDAGLRLHNGMATGTGTDCLAVASDEGDVKYAGMHTEVGEAIGRAVYDAVRLGADAWMSSQGSAAGEQR